MGDIYPYYFSTFMKNNYNLQNFDLYRFIAKKERICDKIPVFKFNRLSDLKISDDDSLFYDVSISEVLGQHFLNLGRRAESPSPTGVRRRAHPGGGILPGCRIV